MLPFDPLPTLSKFGERSDRYVGYKLCSSPLGGYLEAQIPRGYTSTSCVGVGPQRGRQGPVTCTGVQGGDTYLTTWHGGPPASLKLIRVIIGRGRFDTEEREARASSLAGRWERVKRVPTRGGWPPKLRGQGTISVWP